MHPNLHELYKLAIVVHVLAHVMHHIQKALTFTIREFILYSAEI